MPNQLARTFVDAYHRRGFVIGLLIQVQKLFHTPNKLGSNFGNTPLFLQPGLDRVFFKTRRTVSSEISSTTFSWTSLFASKCMVQHVRRLCCKKYEEKKWSMERPSRSFLYCHSEQI